MQFLYHDVFGDSMSTNNNDNNNNKKSSIKTTEADKPKLDSRG